MDHTLERLFTVVTEKLLKKSSGQGSFIIYNRQTFAAELTQIRSSTFKLYIFFFKEPV